MKKTGLILGACALLMFVFSSTVFAQENGRNKEASAAKRLEKMKERLSLTDSQTTQIEEINKAYSVLVDEARAKEYAGKKDKMKAIRAIRKEQDEKITALLDDNQKAEWEKMKEEKKEKMKERRGKRKNAGN